MFEFAVMKKTPLFLMLLMIVSSLSAKRYTVVDASDISPVVGATVIDKAGIIQGMTDSIGCIMIDDSKLPMTVRCSGYNPLEVSSIKDTVLLHPIPYELKEVVVNPIDRPIKRVVCFAREYSTGITGPDSLRFYCEYMTENYIVYDKVKGYRKSDSEFKQRSFKRYAHITRNGRDSIFKPDAKDDITLLSWFEIMAEFPKKFELAGLAPGTKLEDGVIATYPGKYGIQSVIKKKNGQISQTEYHLCNHKDRKWSPLIFKLFGFTIDMTDASSTHSFVYNDSHSYDIYDLMSGTYNLHLNARGKWWKKFFDTKKPVEMDSYIEVYPVEITNLTVDEYKEMRDEKSELPFVYPDNIIPLSPYVDNLVKTLDEAR